MSAFSRMRCIGQNFCCIPALREPVVCCYAAYTWPLLPIHMVRGAVYVIALAMAIYMVVHFSKQFKALCRESKNECSVSNSFNKPQIR